MNQALDPFRALTRTFLARFFENEITAGFDDLKGMFFWLLAALTVPGLFIPWLMSFDWNIIALLHGPEALREASQAEKVFYLGFAMATSGLLTVTAWSSLLPDRRDALVLGALPVGPRTIVAAKLAALAVYILLVAVSMHVLSAVFFGAMLGVKASSLFALRGIFAHFVAASAASAAVALVVAAAQGVALAVAGPRLFKRISTMLQACLVGLIAAGLASLPVISFAAVHTVRGAGSRARPWILSTPPMWFLGFYEWLLGTSNPVLLGLAEKAGWTLLIAAALTVTTYPIAYRRQIVSAVEGDGKPDRPGAGALFRALLIGSAGRDAEARAAADFYTATLGRVERHRFALAMALGLAITWSLFGWTAMDPSDRPEAGWLSLPLSSMIFLVVGLRVAASLPGDMRAAWLFDMTEPSRAHARRALERVIVVLGILPPVVLSAPVYWWIWGRDVALVHAAVLLAVGTTLMEVLIWHCDRMPCGQPWQLARANLGLRWPLYVGVFLVVTIGVPKVEVLVFPHPRAAAAFIGSLVLIAAATRYASARHVLAPIDDDVDPVAGVLRLN